MTSAQGRASPRLSPSTSRPERPERKSVQPIVPPGRAGLQAQAAPAPRRRVLPGGGEYKAVINVVMTALWKEGGDEDANSGTPPGE